MWIRKGEKKIMWEKNQRWNGKWKAMVGFPITPQLSYMFSQSDYQRACDRLWLAQVGECQGSQRCIVIQRLPKWNTKKPLNVGFLIWVSRCYSVIFHTRYIMLRWHFHAPMQTHFIPFSHHYPDAPVEPLKTHFWIYTRVTSLPAYTHLAPLLPT